MESVVNAAADPRNGTDWSDVTFVHCTRWQDASVAQISHGSSAYPNNSQSKAWDLWRDRGAHVSIADLIEAQMRQLRAGRLAGHQLHLHAAAHHVMIVCERTSGGNSRGPRRARYPPGWVASMSTATT